MGLLLLTGVLLLAGCGAGAGTAAGSASASAAGSAPAPHSAKTVEPLPATLHADALDDCTFAAGFQASDVVLNDDGMMVVHLTVYDYELFDLVDISQLAAGDTLVIDKKSMAVKSVQRDESGMVTVNGGLENGGCELVTDEDGVFYENMMDDEKSYYRVGEATLPISQDFLFTDSSQLNSPEKKSYAGDFLSDMKDSDRTFTPNATTVTVEDGRITGITQIYVP
jgi:hypothetical protein